MSQAHPGGSMSATEAIQRMRAGDAVPDDVKFSLALRLDHVKAMDEESTESNLSISQQIRMAVGAMLDIPEVAALIQGAPPELKARWLNERRGWRRGR
jgi:hypothetical protein